MRSTGRIVERDDAKQERELRRLEGRRAMTSTLGQIEADLWRKRLDSRRSGRALVSIDARREPTEQNLHDRLATAPAEQTFEVSRDPWDRAFRLLEGVPEPTRAALRQVLAVLRACGTRRKIQVWRQQNPGRKATQEQIAVEIGVARETVTRALGAMASAVLLALLVAPLPADAGRPREVTHRLVYLAPSCEGAALVLETGDDPPEEHRIEDEPRVLARIEAAELPTCRLVRAEDVPKLTARCSNDARRVAAFESELTIAEACP